MKLTNFKLAIGFPLSHHYIHSAFFASFATMKTPPYVYLQTSNGPIEEMRNGLVEEALALGCSHLIMMDTDQVYHKDTIPRLLSHKTPVVGCLIFRRYPPFDPIMLKGSIGKYQTIDEWEPDSLVEVDATGTGCLLFDMEVFRSMPYPWFRVRRHMERTGAPSVIGEDIGFCSELKDAGYRIFVDTSVPAGHISQLQITEGTWRLYNRLKDIERMHRAEHGVIETAKAG